MKGDACTYILTPESLFEVVSMVEVFVSLFVCLFLTAIRKTKKTLISLQVTHIISVSHTLTFQTHNYADAHPNMQNPWNGTILHINTKTVQLFLSISFPTFPPTAPVISLCIHLFLHPPPSKASSQQSAIEFHYSQVMQHFKRSSAARVCAVLWARVHAQYSVSERHLFIFCYVQQKSSADTQHWCPQTIFMGYCVQAGFLHFFLDLAHAVSDSSFG